jgi:hypothetical protein
MENVSPLLIFAFQNLSNGVKITILDNVYMHMHFCFKYLGHFKTQILKNDYHLKVLGIHLYILSHLWEHVWVLVCFFNLHHFSTQLWLQAHD